MKSLAWLALLGSCASISCGARSSLLDLLASQEEGEPSGGGENGGTTTAGTGTGGAGGGAPGRECANPSLTDYALSQVVLDGPSIHSVEMTKVTGSATTVCVAGRIQEQAPTTPYGAICFEAFGAWPAGLDLPTPLAGSSVGQLRLAPGVPDGIAIITGDDGDIVAPVGKYLPSWSPGDQPVWLDLDGGGEIVPTFLTLAGDFHITGLALGDAFETWLSVSTLVPTPADFVGAACAEGPIVAGGIYNDGNVIVVASSGASVGGCLVEPVSVAQRLQVADWSFGGLEPPALLLDELMPAAIDDVAIADAGSSVWVAALVQGEVYAARVSKTGGVEVPLTSVANGVGPMSIATRGDELLLATIDWTDADLAADIIVHRVSPDGAVGSFGGFETNEAPWVSDLALEVSDDRLHAVVAYHTGPGQLAARRFDCEDE